MIATFAIASTLGISGIYLEARTCSIFAGPCHYNGEVMTDGRGALLAVKFERGGDLAGLSAAAAVVSELNLGARGDRRSVVYIDARATEAQGRRIVAILVDRAGGQLGRIVAIRPGLIDFKLDGLVGDLTVRSGGSLVSEVKTSGEDCKVCSMPGVLWYEPILSGASPSVATVESQSFTDPVLGETWRRSEEPAAFVGRFSL